MSKSVPISSSTAKAQILIQAIKSSLDDAKVSRAMFQAAISESSPGPIALRVYLKAFLYFFHEIVDFSHSTRSKKDPVLTQNLLNLNQIINSSTTIKYLKEARDSMSHNPVSFIDTQGGWTKITPPERNPDGSLNPGSRWDHIPGTVVISEVTQRNGVSVPLPSPHAQKFSNAEIARMMDFSISEIEGEISKL
jgi:hypothetical protein